MPSTNPTVRLRLKLHLNNRNVFEYETDYLDLSACKNLCERLKKSHQDKVTFKFHEGVRENTPLGFDYSASIDMGDVSVVEIFPIEDSGELRRRRIAGG